MSLRDLLKKKKKAVVITSSLPTSTPTATSTSTTSTTLSSTTKPAPTPTKTPASTYNAGVGGTYNTSTGTYTSSTGEGFSVAEQYVPFAEKTTPLTSGGGGGRSSAGGGKNLPQSTIKTPTQPSQSAFTKTKEYAQTLSPAYQTAIMDSAKKNAKLQTGRNWDTMTSYERNKYIREQYERYNALYKEDVKKYAEKEYKEEQYATAKPSEKLGGAFLKKEEVSSYPQFVSNELSVNDLFLQERITTAEKILGYEEGSSGAGFIGAENLQKVTIPERVSGFLMDRYEKKVSKQSYTLLGETGEFKEYSGKVPSMVSGYSEQDIRRQNANVLKVLFLGGTSVPRAVGFKTSSFIFTRGVQKVSQGKTTTQTQFFTSTGKRGVTTSEFSLTKSLDKVRVYTGETGGTFYKQGVQFPTGKVVTKLPSQFYGQEVLVGKQIGKTGRATFQFSLGKIGRYFPMKGDVLPSGGLSTKNIFRVREGYVIRSGYKGFIGAGLGFKVGRRLVYISRVAFKSGESVFGAGSVRLSSAKPLLTMGKRGSTSFGSRMFPPTIKPVLVEKVEPLIPLITKIETRTISLPSLSRAISITSLSKLTLPSVSATSTTLPSTTSLTKINTIQTPSFKLGLSLSQPSKTKQILRQLPRQIPIQVSTPMQVPKQIVTPKQIPKQISLPKQIITPKIIKPPIPPRNVPPIVLFPSINVGTGGARGTGFFGVQVRRFGTFKSIGSGLSLQRAVNLGRTTTTKTLGATFKITGSGNKRIRTPFGYYQKGDLFIEKPKYRLSTTGEIGEIQMFKTMKGGLNI